MKPRDLFGVGVRLLGVWFAVDCFTYSIGFIIRRFDNYDSKLELANPVPYGTYDYGFFAVLYGFLAVYCLFVTEHLVRWTYGEDRRRWEEGPPPDPATPKIASSETRSDGENEI